VGKILKATKIQTTTGILTKDVTIAASSSVLIAGRWRIHCFSSQVQEVH
jgi:hypothetical protein